MKKFTRIVTMAAAVGTSGLAQAAFIDVVANPGGALAPVSSDNSYASRNKGTFVADQFYDLSSNVLLSYAVISTTSDPFRLTFTYLGKEAGYIGSFLYEGLEVFNTGISALGATFSTVYSAGPGKLDFGFSSVKPGGVSVGSVSNLDESNQVPLYNYSIFELGVDYMILSLDDNNRVDDDHDDMLVMLKAFSVQVPEPGTLALLALGLAGLVFTRRQAASS